VVALTEYDPEGTDSGRVAERAMYMDGYGTPLMVSSGGSVGDVSSIGNPFWRQGLGYDAEKQTYQNRLRDYGPSLHKFAQRDPLEYIDSPSMYTYVISNPMLGRDPAGLLCEECGSQPNPKCADDADELVFCDCLYRCRAKNCSSIWDCLGVLAPDVEDLLWGVACGGGCIKRFGPTQLGAACLAGCGAVSVLVDIYEFAMCWHLGAECIDSADAARDRCIQRSTRK
jgi:RHS repeat-associated protein